MSIASEITRINNNIAATYTALSAKGATMPATENSANLASTVATVPSGGGAPTLPQKRYNVNNGVVTSIENENFASNAFDGITEIADSGMYGCFLNAVVGGGLVFKDLTTLGRSSLYDAFRNTRISSVNFKNLVSTPAQSYTSTAPFNYTFASCRNLKEIYFPELVTVGDNSFYDTFQSAGGVVPVDTVSFPKLTTINYRGFSLIFEGTKFASGTTITFPSLTTIDFGLYNTFNNCTGLTSISFPKLTSVNSLAGSFASSGITEIHFRQDMQSTIEALTGYSSKFGASNATVYFDLTD